MDDQSHPNADFLDPELDLLGNDVLEGGEDSAAKHAFKTAPVFTGDALDLLGSSVLPQRALYGRLVSQNALNLEDNPVSPKLFVNTNAPFSALVCGVQVCPLPYFRFFVFDLVQGSGKSHSTSVLLESCLIQDSRIGTLPAPLSALMYVYRCCIFCSCTE